MSVIDDVHAKVRNAFTYVTDKEQYDKREQWVDHADEVINGEDFEGDCDDYALTCATLCSRAGINDDQIRIIFCQVETGGFHLVCAVDTDDDTLILDNRQKWVMSAAELPEYDFIKGRRLSDDCWKRIT
jgi:predicted transglutaminase-like cysteine proteinase